jgi:hypothetical protein
VIAGLSTTFRTGGKHALDKGALIQEVTALHVAVGRPSDVSVSEQIAALRRLLLGWESRHSPTVGLLAFVMTYFAFHSSQR